MNAPTSPRPGAFLLQGLPDNGLARVYWQGWDQPPGLGLDGTAGFLEQMREPPLALHSVLFGGESFRLAGPLPPQPGINYMADADLYGRGLAQAAIFVQRLGIACFNHPVAVLGTTRHGVAAALDGIAGLVVPRTARVQVDTRDQLLAAMEAAGIGFPVIVRRAMDRGHGSTALMRHDADWQALHPLGWAGRPLDLTQFVDYADADGAYRNMRLAVVGGQVFARHQTVANHWSVHAGARSEGGALEEAAFMRGFEQTTLPAVGPILRDMTTRLKLDYFGVDASLRPDGSLLLLKANARMNLLLQPPGAAAWVAPQVARIEQALKALLAAPGRWWHRPTPPA